MPFHQDPEVVKGFLRFSRIAAVLTSVMALAALISCWWDLPQLAAVVAGHPPMTANVAIGFALSGASLLLARADGWWRAPSASVLSLAVLAIGAATLGEHIFAIEPSIDRGFASAEGFSFASIFRPMTDLIAAALMLMGGLGLLVSLRCCFWLRDACAIALLAMAMVGLASHGFAMAGASDSLFDQVPTQTTLLLLLAALGWLCAMPTTGLTRVATAATLGGKFARSLLLPALMLPVVFTYVFKLLQSWLGMPEVLTFSLMAVFTGGTVACLIWWVAVLLDKLERQRRESARLRTDADTDILTGLANRRAFDEVLASLLQGQRRHDTEFSLLMLDLDKFKSYNDDFGHLAGDEVLRITGRLLGAAVRPADLAARYGGEEFALLLPAAETATTDQVATRVLRAFRTFAWPHRAVTISIGVAQWSVGDDAATLIARADAALYEAKNTGRDHVVRAASLLAAPIAS
jgi:diguanylate cyclase (GGDEF)-like protein